MVTYLYCFSRSSGDREVPRLGESKPGIAGAAIRTLALPNTDPADGQRAVAWVSSLERIPPLTAVHVAEHDRICDAVLATDDDVLPVRFGQVFESDIALTGYYQQRAAAVRPVWQHIANAVEMSLTAVAREDGTRALSVGNEDLHTGEASRRDTASSTGTGYAYLSALAGPIRERRRLRELVEPFRIELRTAAGTLIRDETVHAQDAPSATVLSHLVPRDAVSAYRGLVARVEIAHPLIRVLLLGPHAPYSFVALETGTPA